MISKFIQNKLIIAFVSVIAVLTFGLGSIQAQTGPLNLGQVLTGLQSKSGGFSIAEKNAFITQNVMKRGVTFTLSPVIRGELQNAGASANLIRAIAIKGPKRPPAALPRKTPLTTKPKPSAASKKIWVVPNTSKGGMKGFEVHSALNVYNLKDSPSQITIRFKKGASYLLSSRNSYRNKAGHLARFQTIKPKFSSTVYKDMMFFIPFKELNLPIGVHNLKAEIALIRNGRLVQNINSYPFVLRLPVKTSYIPRIKFNKITIDHGKTLRGKRGMIVYSSFSISNFKAGDGRIALLFSKANGEKLTTTNKTYKNLSGQVTIYRKFSPKYPSTSYKKLTVFVPYEAFGLTRGRRRLSLRAELIYSDGTVISRLGSKSFSYTK